MAARSLVEWIEEASVDAHPDKPAVVGDRDALGWGELLRGARALGAFLREAGVGRGDRVGLWMDKTPRCVQALLGVLHAGAAYVPLDPRAPVARVAGIARDDGLAAVFADAPRGPQLPAFLAAAAPALLVLDDPDLDRRAAAALARGRRVELLADALAFPPSEPARPAPDDLAYVLYTSGSTGTPKGVVHTHASGLSFARWVRDRFAIRSDDVFTGHAPLHFDLSVSDLFASLGAGASVRLLSPTEGMLAPYLVRMLDVWGVSVWYSVPSALVAMLEQGGLEARPPDRLRLVLFAGEVFPMPQLRRLRRALPGTTLVNLFGPTETNVCTYHVVPESLPAEAASLPIGKACENMETFVLGDDGAELAVPGVEGTLWARGGNLMAGYWADPARTAAVLQPDPRGRPGLACNTGDRVRLLPDGTYEFRGRRDHMVKVRGHRVELGEIEAVLAEHPAVREAVAVALPDAAAGNRLVAVVVPRAGAPVAAQDLPGALVAHLAARLPRYMLPERVAVLGELPRTSNGKADRARLREWWETGGDHGRDHRAQPG
jgi:amino acid adenylation domain-containing protein